MGLYKVGGYLWRHPVTVTAVQKLSKRLQNGREEHRYCFRIVALPYIANLPRFLIVARLCQIDNGQLRLDLAME